MDEEYSESVDTSADMDVSDTDVAEDIPTDIPDDVPEDIPEDDYSDSDIADDFSEDVSDDAATDEAEYDDVDDSTEEDSIEPEAEEMDDSIDDFEEDSYDDSEIPPEDDAETEDIPGDSDEIEETAGSEMTDVEDVPEDIGNNEDVGQDESYVDEIAEDVADDEVPEETADTEDTEAAEQPEDMTDAEAADETADVENADTIEQPEDVADAETTDETADVENTDTTEQPEDVADAETTDETADVENTDTTERPEDVIDTETADETTDVENADTADQSEEVSDVEAADEATNAEEVSDAETTDETADVENTDTTEQPEDVTDAETADEATDVENADTTEQPDNQSDLETYDYETSPETQDAVSPETSGEFVSAENPYRERWEKFGEEFSDGSETDGWDSLKDVPFRGDEKADMDSDTEGTDVDDSATPSETTDADNSSEASEINSISDYMNAHNYGPDDFATYSQDPQWRQLMRQEYPDYELPEMTQESANAQLSQYMNDHNYGVDDYAEYSQDPTWRELHSAAFPDDELPPLNDARPEQKKPAIAPSGGGNNNNNNNPPSGPDGDDGNHPNPPDGSDGWVCPVCGKNPCVCDTGNNEGNDTPPPPDDPDKVLRRNEFDLLKSGNDAINQRLEAKADDYRDKGLSEDEIADRLAADKWEYQKEFLDDAFPGEDISPNVFNGINEHGAKDRIDEMEKSPFLREIFIGKKNEESDLGQDVVADARTSEYNKTLKDFCESNGYVKNADFSDFDPHVAYDLAKSVVDAKKDFSDLDVNYLGSIDHQVKGLHDTVEAAQFDSYKQNGFDEGLAQQMAKQYADDFISNSKLDDTEGTYAWSLRTGNPSLDKYDGVAVNNDYAKDYTKFKSEKQADEIVRWAPVGCGSPKAVADHELGHEIDNLLGASKDSVINDLYSSMMKDDKAESVLSGYSKTNVKEFIAEAYSEYRNNPNPREVSRAVYNRLIELRDQKALSRRLI